MNSEIPFVVDFLTSPPIPISQQVWSDRAAHTKCHQRNLGSACRRRDVPCEASCLCGCCASCFRGHRRVGKRDDCSCRSCHSCHYCCSCHSWYRRGRGGRAGPPRQLRRQFGRKRRLRLPRRPPRSVLQRKCHPTLSFTGGRRGRAQRGRWGERRGHSFGWCSTCCHWRSCDYLSCCCVRCC